MCVRHLLSCVSGAALWAKAAAEECLHTPRLTVLLATTTEEAADQSVTLSVSGNMTWRAS